ncbi:MAG: D-hexose-6-phosphate mutarotase [Tetrasphaera sp.]
MSETEDFQLPEWARLIDAGMPRERYLAATAAGEVTVHTHGGQVTSWRCHGRERLWLSTTAEYAADKAIRGGIPVIYPWFGGGPDGQRKPAHGPARLAQWELAGWGFDYDDDPEAVDLEFALGERNPRGSSGLDGVAGAEGWPPGTRADLQARTGRDSLRVVLTLFNYTEEPVRCEAALHTYLAVSDVEAITIERLDGVSYHDKVAGRDAVQSGAIPFGEEIDRIYATSEPVILRDNDHALRVGSEGATHTVVWNPGREKGPTMADVSDWRGFVCIEAAAIGPGALTIPPRILRDAGRDLPGFVQLVQELTVLVTSERAARPRPEPTR